MSYCEYPPCPALRPFVACYWTREASPIDSGPHLVLPDGCLDFLFRIDALGNIRALVIGTMRTAAHVPDGHRTAYVGVRFFPGGVHPFLRLGCDELTDGAGALDSLWQPSRGFAAGELAELGSRERVARVELHLLRHLPEADAADRRLRAATALAWRAPAVLTVDDLAAATGWGARQLERRFLERVGIGPKLFLRVLRLQAFVAGRRNGAGAALDAGYFDQAHLIREFRELAGMTPGQYFGMSDLSNPPSPLSS